MSENEQTNLLRHVNASGFPLQLRLEREVSLRGDWQVVATEFRWEDPRSGQSGFVDLIIQRPPVCFVIECKRRTGGAWTFLHLSEFGGRHHVRFCYVDRERKRVRVMDYGAFDPRSVESQYCVVPGSGQSDRRSLERIASELVLATESIAEAYRTLPLDPPPRSLAFIPVIVCTPPPAVASFSVDGVSLETGTVGDDAEVRSVRLVRFRKPFAVEASGSERHVESLRDLADDRERTVLVVSAESFGDYLSELRHLNQLHLFPEGSE